MGKRRRVLNERQEAFIAAYIGEAKFNAYKAARMAGYAESSLSSQTHYLTSHPEIRARIDEYLAELKADGLRHKENRIAAAQALFDDLVAIKGERAEEYRRLKEAMGGEPDSFGRLTNMFGERTIPPGAETGLMNRTVKVVGAGRSQQMIEEFNIDTALTKTALDLMERIAREVGEWNEKAQITGADGGPIRIESTDGLREAILRELAPKPDPGAASEGDSESSG